MQREIEAKFLRQNHNEVRQKLRKLGAICKHKMALMRRTVFDFPDRRLQARGAWVRLRKELDGSIELMVKHVASEKLGQTFEHPVVVTDYEAAKQFLLSLALEVKGEQESKREVWRLGEAEIMLDEWPWVPPFIEIEAPSEEIVRNLAKQLGLNWDKAKFGGVTPVYMAEYAIGKEEFESAELSMQFEQPIPAILKRN
ncbi:MAG: class IV adenylate cyclase [Candidatus Saccharimonadales bacterium]